MPCPGPAPSPPWLPGFAFQAFGRSATAPPCWSSPRTGLYASVAAGLNDLAAPAGGVWTSPRHDHANAVAILLASSSCSCPACNHGRRPTRDDRQPVEGPCWRPALRHAIGAGYGSPACSRSRTAPAPSDAARRCP
jgi:hypothetical protein